MQTFKEKLKTWRDKKALLERFAEAIGWIIEECRTPDDWDIEVTLRSKNDYKQSYVSVGSMYPDVYDDLLNIVMHNYRWKTIEEMEVWIDLRHIMH